MSSWWIACEVFSITTGDCCIQVRQTGRENTREFADVAVGGAAWLLLRSVGYMATQTRVELHDVFDGNNGEEGLTEFDPEPQAARDADRLWLRDEHPREIDARPVEPFVARQETRRWPIIAAVVIAVSALAGGAVSWLGMRSRVEAMPVPAPPAAAGHIAPAPTPAPLAPAPAVVQPPAPSTATPEPRPVPAIAAKPALDPALESTLARVSEAYRRLDASSLTGVWPGADTASLSRSFADLKYQSLSFEHCAVRPNGPTSAIASCDVSLAMAPNGGDQTLQRRHESWTLVLDRSAEPWTIAGVAVR
jgi:hypothetical protein